MKISTNTDSGELTVREFDGGVAKGLIICLNDEPICSVDCYKKSLPNEEYPEVRVSAYKLGEEEPHSISINR